MLQCPVCEGSALKAVRTKQDKVPLDTCPTCRGVWFDDGELAQVLHGTSARIGVPKLAYEDADRNCPRCRTGLCEYCFPETDTLVHGCRICHGTWVGGGDYKSLSAATKPANRMECPKCGAQQAKAERCRECGVFVASFQQREAEKERTRDRLGEIFEDTVSFRVEQKLEWMEILSPFEVRNRYRVHVQGRKSFWGEVEEHSSSFFNAVLRQYLGGMRPAELTFDDEDGRRVLSMRKPFRLFFHRLEMLDTDGRPLGAIERRFHILRSNYDITDASGRTVLQIAGPIFLLPFFEPKFRFMRGEEEVGHVTKRWRRLLREMFTDSDNFDALVDRHLSTEEKVLLFGAVFLIDFVSFENNQDD